ncbi:hypothetical protein JCM16776_0758 [Leptotrichia shahii]|uniref:Uncharacterized protein n=1 Tax=Leptotrichia shahii TaxID=157691 RepID=A0A510JMK4_9FUSO|nr:hypothetical protein [Leptotrichia shahii]BBM40538.1 hypothetical protein JCM16776_0758 [Leptotrichia shahii]
MNKITFLDVEEVRIKLEGVRSLMVALEYGIFDSFESKEIFRVGYANLVEQVYGIQNELDILIEKAKNRVQKDSEEEIA